MELAYYNSLAKKMEKQDKEKEKDQILIQTFQTQTKRPTPKKEKFIFFATGCPNFLLEGIEVDLQMEYNLEQCKSYLKSILQGKINSNIDNYDFLVYLAGGIPFLNGSLSELYLKSNQINIKLCIYGILIGHVSEEELNKEYLELCNIKLNKLLSPICESSLEGMCNIACILSYMNRYGPLCEKFLQSSAAVIHFPPFITCLNKIIYGNSVTGRDIITVTSKLHTYFSYLLDPYPPPNEVFEYALKCCNSIMNIKNENEKMPINFIEINEKTDREISFFAYLIQTNMFYIWNNDCEIYSLPFSPQSLFNNRHQMIINKSM